MFSRVHCSIVEMASSGRGAQRSGAGPGPIACLLLLVSFSQASAQNLSFATPGWILRNQGVATPLYTGNQSAFNFDGMPDGDYNLASLSTATSVNFQVTGGNVIIDLSEFEGTDLEGFYSYGASGFLDGGGYWGYTGGGGGGGGDSLPALLGVDDLGDVLGDGAALVGSLLVQVLGIAVVFLVAWKTIKYFRHAIHERADLAKHEQWDNEEHLERDEHCAYWQRVYDAKLDYEMDSLACCSWYHRTRDEFETDEDFYLDFAQHRDAFEEKSRAAQAEWNAEQGDPADDE